MLGLLHVAFGEVGKITEGEHHVFGLGDLAGPPVDCFFAVVGEPGLAFGAEETIAAVGELADFVAGLADGEGEFGMTVLQLGGEGERAGLAEFGRD